MVDKVNWYPGHMHKSLKLLEETFIPKCHVILEIRDARIPYASKNGRLEQLIKGFNKKRIIVYTKIDVAGTTPKMKKQIEQRVMAEGGVDEVMFANAKQSGSVRHIIGKMRKHAREKFSTLPTIVLVVGVPNVGKSTIINTLRRAHYAGRGRAAVAKHAGVTKHIATFNVLKEPKVQIMDTPGIFLPALDMDDVEHSMKLALTGAVKDKIAGSDNICDYLLFKLNQMENWNYVDLTGLEEPTDDVNKMLNSYATKLELYDHGWNEPDEYAAAGRLIEQYRTGYFGNFPLDEELVPLIKKGTFSAAASLAELSQKLDAG